MLLGMEIVMSSKFLWCISSFFYYSINSDEDVTFLLYADAEETLLLSDSESRFV